MEKIPSFDRRRVVWLVLALAVSGCGDDDSCEAREQAYEDFLAAHAACEIDEDCAVIGDCGPNSDFAPVRADAEEEARALQVDRCSDTYDGPMYRPVCTAGECALETRSDTCCGCP